MKLTFVQWSAFSLGWFGMRPGLFEKLPSRSLSAAPLFIQGISRILLGLAFLYISLLLERSGITIYFLSELCLLIGLSLVLHFGILNLSAAFWRLWGVDVKTLFRSPYQSKSLQEFWGKRWNLAFSEMTALIIYKPLKGNLGTSKAMMAAFLFSGILHEIAISFPVNSGYGLPLCYFLIHGVLMLAEKRIPLITKIILHPRWSHVWVLGWLILPMPLLFHADFIAWVLKPLRDTLLFLYA